MPRTYTKPTYGLQSQAPEHPCDKLYSGLLSALTQKSYYVGPTEKIRQTPSQIEPILDVQEHVIGPMLKGRPSIEKK